MNKTIKRLFTPLTVFAMAIGVGITVNGQREVVGAKAAQNEIVISSIATANGWTNGTKYLTFSSGPLTFTAAGTTNTGKYYTSDQSWRFYSSESASLTITGDSTVQTIDAVTTNPSKTFSIVGKTASHTFTANTNIKSITVVYTLVGSGPVAVQGITLPETADVYVGATYEILPVFNPLDATNKDLTWESDNIAVATVSNGVVTGISPGTAVITATTDDGGYSDSTTVTVTAPTIYSKLTSLSQLHIGASYVIAGTKGSPEETWVMSTTQSSNNRTAVLAEMAGLNIADSPTTQVFVLEEGSVDNTFAFKAINGETADQYIYSAGGGGTSTNNHLKSQATLDANGSWRIIFVDGVLHVQSQGDANRNIMKLNSTSALFASYGSGQVAVDLYLDLTSVDDNAYAKAYNLAYDINVGQGVGASGTCEAILSSISSRYDSLSPSAKTLFDTNSGSEFVSARARISYLTSWVAAHPSERSVIQPASSRNSLAAAITISAIGLTTILGYYFIKRKENLG